MPTLLEDLHALLSVQAIDTRIERAKSALNTLDSGADIAAVYNAGKAEFDALRAAMVKAQSEQKDAELKLQSLEEKRTEVEKTLYSGGITASRELDSLNMQLDMLERQRGDFEETVLKAMDFSNVSLKNAQKAEARLLALAEKYKKVRAAYKQQAVKVAADVSEIEKERVGLITGITPTVLGRYDTIRMKRKGIGIALMGTDGACGACHTKLSSNLRDDVLVMKQPMTCEHCGRLLAPPSAA
ncbi:MAG: C4-type zinc ribbon domain-containing protein [bacterium]|jgi:hypothetical protein